MVMARTPCYTNKGDLHFANGLNSGGEQWLPQYKPAKRPLLSIAEALLIEAWVKCSLQL